jgi:ketosteroid isomerase-like protein
MRIIPACGSQRPDDLTHTPVSGGAMTRILVLSFAFALLLPPFGTAQSSDVTTVLQGRYSGWMNAFRRGDGAAMDRMETTGLMLIFEDGTIWSKEKSRAEELKGRGPIPFTHTLEQVRARVEGDVAILTGIQNDVNTKDGSRTRAPFTTVWKKEGGDWKIWSAHWSQVPEKK